MEKEFWGFERKNGSPGVRNYVGVISAMDNMNPIARKIVQSVHGSLLISDLFGRKQAGVNHEIKFRTLTGLGKNPNIGRVLVVSLHKPSAISLAEAISSSRKEAEFIAYQEIGSSIRSIEQGSRIVAKMVKKCSEERRTAQPISKLSVGVECGGSDFSSGISGNPTIGNVADRLLDAGGKVVMSETPEVVGAEQILARRAISPTVANKLLACVRRVENHAKMAGYNDIRQSNPSADNMKGGLTTLAEKSIGAILKGGSKPLRDVLEFGEQLPSIPGFYFMDTPAPACESLTGMASGGVQIILFNTGIGNPIGNPVAPTIKITGNPFISEECTDDIDVNVSEVMRGGMSLEEAGETLFEEVIKVANGKKTYSEILGIIESTIHVMGPSI